MNYKTTKNEKENRKSSITFQSNLKKKYPPITEMPLYFAVPKVSFFKGNTHLLTEICSWVSYVMKDQVLLLNPVSVWFNTITRKHNSMIPKKQTQFKHLHYSRNKINSISWKCSNPDSTKQKFYAESIKDIQRFNVL